MKDFDIDEWQRSQDVDPTISVPINYLRMLFNELHNAERDNRDLRDDVENLHAVLQSTEDDRDDWKERYERMRETRYQYACKVTDDDEDKDQDQEN